MYKSHEEIREKTALHEVGFQIEENSITGLIGRNGSGKTTFMKIACGILQPSSGEIEVLGYMPYGEIRVAKDAIYSFHNYPHPEKMKLKHILEFYRNLFPNFDNEFDELLFLRRQDEIWFFITRDEEYV